MSKKEIGKYLIELELKLLRNFPKRFKKPTRVDTRPVNINLYSKISQLKKNKING